MYAAMGAASKLSMKRKTTTANDEHNVKKPKPPASDPDFDGEKEKHSIIENNIDKKEMQKPQLCNVFDTLFTRKTASANMVVATTDSGYVLLDWAPKPTPRIEHVSGCMHVMAYALIKKESNKHTHTHRQTTSRSLTS